MSSSSFRSHCGEIGRHEGLKIPFWRQSAGSSPAGGMERSKLYGKTYDFWAFFFLRMDCQKINRTACGDIGGVSDIPRRRAVGGTLYPRTGNTLASDNEGTPLLRTTAENAIWTYHQRRGVSKTSIHRDCFEKADRAGFGCSAKPPYAVEKFCAIFIVFFALFWWYNRGRI